MNDWIPANKQNYLAFHGIGGALWSMNYSMKRMCEEVFQITAKDMRRYEDLFDTTYSERCNASDYFREHFKTLEDLNEEWEKVKAGKSDYPFSNRHHTPMPPIFRII